jgi:hypothetical protein
LLRLLTRMGSSEVIVNFSYWNRCYLYGQSPRCLRRNLLLHDLQDLFSLNYGTEKGSRVSSGNIVSDYGLDDREIGVRSTAGA